MTSTKLREIQISEAMCKAVLERRHSPAFSFCVWLLLPLVSTCKALQPGPLQTCRPLVVHWDAVTVQVVPNSFLNNDS